MPNIPKARIPASGSQVVPAPQTNLDAATFNGVYLRPNFSNGGLVPAQGPLCTSPDIWIAGTQPVGNFQSALATAASYQTESSSNISQGNDNYIYVRALNGTSVAQSRTVQLYYAPSALILWPSQWQNNVIKTDQGNAMANISDLAAGQVGVADQTFLWPNVQPPPAGSDHYCLLAQLNDANNDNPFPSISSQLDLAALIANNLGWGCRNVTLIAGGPATFQFEAPLTIPQFMPTGTYLLLVNSTGFLNWTTWFTCSQADANGNPIALPPTEIVVDGGFLGAPACTLAGGFDAIITLYMQSNGNSASPGASVTLSCLYMTNPAETEEMVRRGLVDWNLNAKLGRALDPEIAPTPVVFLGAQTWQLVPSSNNVS